MLNRDVCFGFIWHRHSQRLAHYPVHLIKWQNNFKKKWYWRLLRFSWKVVWQHECCCCCYERWVRLFCGTIKERNIRWIMSHMWAHKNRSYHTFITCHVSHIIQSCHTDVLAQQCALTQRTLVWANISCEYSSPEARRHTYKIGPKLPRAVKFSTTM